MARRPRLAEPARLSRMNIILIGPPGSGKGVQAQLLSTQYDIPHISVGALFREQIKKRTLIGQQAESYVKKGQLVPDKITVTLLLRRIRQRDAQRGYILDGFPRTEEQMKLFHYHIPPQLVFYIHVPPRLTIKRIAGRRQCSRCGKIYGTSLQEQKKGHCDACQGLLITREDDRPPIVKKRLDIFKQEITPILRWYKEQEVLIRIDGTKSIKTVNAQITAHLQTTARQKQ
ncbi:adenylate kinase [Candidatus Woesearchaeota archaeon]|nr:adenylate kinase [Candidatus Woesearchaeota archaeon]